MKSISKVTISVSNEEREDLKKAKGKIDDLFMSFQGQGCDELDCLADASAVIDRVLNGEEFDGRIVTGNKNRDKFKHSDGVNAATGPEGPLVGTLG